MTSLVLSHVCFAHTDAVPILEDCSLRLAGGWTGVVGPNGCGKTTLLRVLAGELAAEAGAVRFAPPHPDVRTCRQTVERIDAEVGALAEALDGPAQRLRDTLGLDPASLGRWSTLSPGERKRWQVGGALHAAPDVLLLDEPTNHLDAPARERLVAALAEFSGLGLLVSHDRTLLDALTTHTIRFRHGGVRLWSGSYEVARRAWEQEEREQLDAYQRLQSEKRKVRRRLGDARRLRAQAEAKMKRTMRRASPKDIDTRKRFSAKRRRSAEASLGREIHKLRDTLGRLDAQGAGQAIHKELGRSLGVDWETAPHRQLFAHDEDLLRIGDRVLARGARVAVARDSRIHLAGPNGAGKSTLIARLREHGPPDDRVLYLPQELSPEAGAVQLAALREAPAEERGRALTLAAALGVDPEALLASEAPSPGETRKLALAHGLARRVWALVLDEPTNHLDLPSVERLETALAAYPGALVMATHDAAFAARLTDTVWRFDAGTLRVATRSDGDA